MKLLIPKGTVVQVSFNCVNIYFPKAEQADAFAEWMAWIDQEKERPGGLDLNVKREEEKPIPKI